MELTYEQYQIINSKGDIKINAVAGSGKTTTMIEYAQTRPSRSKILYIAFNKSVKLEAAKKFADKGLTNVKVDTAHSLAYRYIVPKYQYKVKPQGYTTNEIVELLNLQGTGEQHTEYIIANHINKFITYFCNSDKQKVRDLNYLHTLTDPKAKAFISTFHEYIVARARLFLSKMNNGEVEITHDFYLKKFQLSNPQLPYDYILFDEGQDASAAMLDIFLKQKATKVIVGDTHQQIYGWRFAINSLEKTDFQTYHLSTSFRFDQDIANLAMEVLKLKKHLGQETSTTPIIGKGNNHLATKSKAILARTNLGLLLKAIEYVIENKQVKRLYFEGNFNSYTYGEEGASLYDVLNLYNEKHSFIKDPLIKTMRDLEALEDYIEKTEDTQLSMMLEIVKEYGNRIPGIIKAIKEKHVDNEEKGKAEMIFSTVHRCKGMEYGTIQLINDFISEKKLEKLKEDKEALPIIASKLNEEINLLYVAVTRTKSSIYIPEVLMPYEFPASPQIHVMKTITEQETTKQKSIISISSLAAKQKAYSMDEAGVKYKEAYKPWTPELDDQLIQMFRKGATIKEIAQHFGRTHGAIVSRIKKLQLEEL